MSHPNQDRNYAVLGTGALGGLYGGLLAKAGKEVHFLLRSDFEHVREQGLRVDSHWGDFHLSEPNVYRRPEEMPKVDVVLVCWKSTANESLAIALESVCHDSTIVLVLQNGLDVEQAAANTVGQERVLGGCCFLCSNKIGPGHIHHLDYGGIAFGEYSVAMSGRITERMSAIDEDFKSAGIDSFPSRDLRLVRWKKLVWNIPFNGLSVVLGANTSDIMDDPFSCQLARALMLEVQQAAKVNDVEIPLEHVEKMLADTKKMVPYDSSMLVDYKNRRSMEVESIFGNPFRSAQSAGYTPSKIEMLYQQLSFLNAQNCG